MLVAGARRDRRNREPRKTTDLLRTGIGLGMQRRITVEEYERRYRKEEARS